MHHLLRPLLAPLLRLLPHLPLVLLRLVEGEVAPGLVEDMLRSPLLPPTLRILLLSVLLRLVQDQVEPGRDGRVALLASRHLFPCAAP